MIALFKVPIPIKAEILVATPRNLLQGRKITEFTKSGAILLFELKEVPT